MSKDETACERCSGMGWQRIHHTVRDKEGIAHDRSEYPDCRQCKGTGIQPKDAPEVDRG